MKATKVLTSLLPVFLLAGCQGNTHGHDADTSTDEEFHADNDIAMTVRSLADAIAMDEPLDSALYNFEGVLTDGQGRPLYTDVDGNPGNWLVTVSDSTTALICNTSPGDLLPERLQEYLHYEINMTPVLLVDDEYDRENVTALTVYDFGAGLMRFETREAVTPAGIRGEKLSILITANR